MSAILDALGQSTEQTVRIPVIWQWSKDAIKAALACAGTPPNLDIQAMMNAAFGVDGAALTAMVMEHMVSERMQALDAAPVQLDVRDVGTVEFNGGFLLALLSDEWGILSSRVTNVIEASHGTDSSGGTEDGSGVVADDSARVSEADRGG